MILNAHASFMFISTHQLDKLHADVVVTLFFCAKNIEAAGRQMSEGKVVASPRSFLKESHSVDEMFSLIIFMTETRL